MELVRSVMLNVIILVFFTTLLDLLLPVEGIRSYVKLAMGFITVLMLLQPVVQLLERNPREVLQNNALPVIVQETDYTDWYIKQVEEQYAQQTAKQVEALLSLSNYTVESVHCTLEPEVMLTIQLSHCTDADLLKVQTSMSGYFGLLPSQVQVVAIERSANT